jgi:hypothetical protein
MRCRAWRRLGGQSIAITARRVGQGMKATGWIHWERDTGAMICRVRGNHLEWTRQGWALLEGVNEDEAPPEGFIEDECLWVTALIDLSVQNRKTCQFEEESMSWEQCFVLAIRHSTQWEKGSFTSCPSKHQRQPSFAAIIRYSSLHWKCILLLGLNQ